MADTRLIIRDTATLDRIYHMALAIADPERAAAAQGDWGAAYLAGDYRDIYLASAVANALRMPFGAYVVLSRDRAHIEVTSWALAERDDRQSVASMIKADDRAAIRREAHALRCAVDYLDWLDIYQSAGKE